MQKGFFRSSNKWDAATDMLSNKHKLEGMQERHGRKKHKYKYTAKCILQISKFKLSCFAHSKRKHSYWEGEIYETQKEVRE